MPAARRAAPPIYTPADRVRLVTEIQRRFAAGEGTIRAIAASLGTTETSYHNWVKAGVRPPGMPAMRSIEVTAPSPELMALVPAGPTALTVAPAPKAAPVPLTLVGPGGYRLEGLDVEGAAALLKALSC